MDTTKDSSQSIKCEKTFLAPLLMRLLCQERLTTSMVTFNDNKSPGT